MLFRGRTERVSCRQMKESSVSQGVWPLEMLHQTHFATIKEK